MAALRGEFITDLNNICDSRHTVHTIGHSTRAIEVFLELLQRTN